jgi:hypothetical protein
MQSVLIIRRISQRMASSLSVSQRCMATSPLTEYKVKPIVIDQNLKLWSLTSIRTMNNLESSENSRRRKLMVLFAYMLPNEKHLDKYRKIYYDHGFDVLTVQTSPFQFFFPAIGAKKVADHVYEFIDKQGRDQPYPDVLVHAFSVGGYQFSEFLNKLYTMTGERGQRMREAIKGTIFDSPCNVDSVPYGLSRTIAGNTLLARMIEGFVNATRSIFYPLSTKYHREGEQLLIHRPLLCPSLFFASRSDKMADIDVIKQLVQSWSGKGVDVKLR